MTGAIAGPIGSKAGSSLISKLAWYGSGGATGGVAGGQVSALTEATWDEAASLLSGSGVNGDRFLNTAKASGFIDDREIVVDAASGTVLAWAGTGLNAALSKALPHGLRPWQPEVPRATVVKLTPTLDGPRMYFELEGNWVVVPPDRTALFLQGLAQGLVDVTSDIIIEAVGTNVDLDTP